MRASRALAVPGYGDGLADDVVVPISRTLGSLRYLRLGPSPTLSKEKMVAGAERRASVDHRMEPLVFAPPHVGPVTA